MTRLSFPFLLLLVAGLVAIGCTVGPKYQRPETPIPATYRGAEDAAAPAAPKTFADLAWWQLFGDPDLQALIRQALAANYDLRVAVTRILQAQAQLTAIAADQYPKVDARADAPYTAYLGGSRPETTSAQSFTPSAALAFGWELDLWGKFRRATEAAQAQLLASQDVREAVQISLVAQVALAYFTLRALDADLEISNRTVVSRQQSRDLVQARLDGGVAGILDLRQAETLLYGATKTIPDIQRQIEQTENFISILLGKSPAPIPRGLPLEQRLGPPALPPGLPVELLARRPDVRQAEQQLVAANARIGVAKAQLYPQVGISAVAGITGFITSGQNYGPLGVLNVLPFINLPLFNAGALQAGVDFAEAQTQEAVLRYQQTVQQAVQEVADALVEVRKRREFREQQVLLTKTLGDASEVARLRYEGGVSSYLEVLDTERQFFQAELDLTLARRDELNAIVQLFRALGGGWQAEPAASSPASPSGGRAPGATVAAAQ
jgi:multidrug efflux system outer membrane protein